MKTPEEVLAALWRLVASPWVRLWRKLRASVRAVVKVLVCAPTLLLASSSPAFADSSSPAALAWIRILDSTGVGIWQYQMSLDNGGATSPGKLLWSSVVEFLWEIYRGGVAFAAWLVDWTISFEWLTWVATPVTVLGDNLQAMVDRFGAVPTLLTLSAFMAVILMARGNWSTGAYDLVLSLVIAALATGILASPVRVVAGDDGLLMSARDFGVEFAEGLDPTTDTSGGDTEAESPYGPNAVYVRGFCFPRLEAGFGRPRLGCNGDYVEGYFHLFPLSQEKGFSRACAVYDSQAVLAHMAEITEHQHDDQGGHQHDFNKKPATFDSSGQLTKKGTIYDPEGKVVRAVGVRCPQAGEDVVNAKPAKMIVDTFLRQPHQLVNFGRILDDTKCEDTYQKALEAGPYSGDDVEDLREEVGDCNEDAQETAENPSASMAFSVLVLLPAVAAVLGLVIVACLTVLLSGFYALYQSLKMIVALVLALLQCSRGSLWMTFADLIISLVMVVFSVCFLSAYMLLIQAVFSSGGSNMKIFFIIDVLMFVGIMLFWKARSRIKAAADRMAAAMAKRPGGGRPGSLPNRPQVPRLSPARAYLTARAVGHGTTGLVGGSKRIAGRAANGVTKLGRGIGGEVAQNRSRLAFAAGVAERQAAGKRLADRLQDHAASSQRGLPQRPRPIALQGGRPASPRQAAAMRRRLELQRRLRPLELGARPPGGPRGGTPGPAPSGPGRAGPEAARPVAPRVVQGTVVASRPAADDPVVRLRERLGDVDARRGTPRALQVPAGGPQR